MRLSPIFSEFFESEKTGGLILMACTLGSLLITNSFLGEGYLRFWRTPLDLSFLNLDLNYPVIIWVNDVLMSVFFLLVGLEIERELYEGELADPRNALLPIGAALGGMIIPLLCYLAFNFRTPSQAGMGIPMATDIAFALGALSLLGRRIPPALKVFLAALAIIDDLGAVIVIALFYTHDLSLFYFGIALAIYGGLILLNRLKVTRLVFYLLPGLVMWYFIHKSGLHATLVGILLAFAVPFLKDKKRCPSYRLQHSLHKPVSFLILPIFALANTGVVLASDWYLSFTQSNGAGILAGLVIGKPLGISLFCVLAIKSGLSRLPDGVTLRHLTGASLLAGIGFTMSIFITNLSFTDLWLIRSSKIAILAASVISGCFGILFLWLSTKPAMDPNPGTSPPE
jgi:Na+:H+ antiporter, NhaA family